MKITVLGAGAMGMLFGSYLSRHNEVWLLDTDEARVRQINAQGITVQEQDGSRHVFSVSAVTSAESLPMMDLILVFVKAMHTGAALDSVRNLIGERTYVMTLQNGIGHDRILSQFCRRDHIILGSTQHNSSVAANAVVCHGGSGQTVIGLLDQDSKSIENVAASFSACGLPCEISNTVMRDVWNKLFTNIGASALTAILQVPLGYIYTDPYARALMKTLVKEAVQVASASGIGFDTDQVIDAVERVCRNAPRGYTSIYADIKNGRPTEVDTISGSVIEAGQKVGVDTPAHRVIVALIHAMEGRGSDPAV